MRIERYSDELFVGMNFIRELGESYELIRKDCKSEDTVYMTLVSGMTYNTPNVLVFKNGVNKEDMELFEKGKLEFGSFQGGFDIPVFRKSLKKVVNGEKVVKESFYATLINYGSRDELSQNITNALLSSDKINFILIDSATPFFEVKSMRLEKIPNGASADFNKRMGPDFNKREKGFTMTFQYFVHELFQERKLSPKDLWNQVECKKYRLNEEKDTLNEEETKSLLKESNDTNTEKASTDKNISIGGYRLINYNKTNEADFGFEIWATLAKNDQVIAELYDVQHSELKAVFASKKIEEMFENEMNIFLSSIHENLGEENTINLTNVEFLYRILNETEHMFTNFNIMRPKIDENAISVANEANVQVESLKFREMYIVECGVSWFKSNPQEIKDNHIEVFTIAAPSCDENIEKIIIDKVKSTEQDYGRHDRVWRLTNESDGNFPFDQFAELYTKFIT